MSSKKGFTLVELIVSILIAAIVIGVASSFLIFGTNILNQSTERSNEQVSATSVAEKISDILLLADEVKIVEGIAPPRFFQITHR
jgi:prepilin-type N-terminal cleavage/methylation domain-containing protein